MQATTRGHVSLPIGALVQATTRGHVNFPIGALVQATTRVHVNFPIGAPVQATTVGPAGLTYGCCGAGYNAGRLQCRLP